MMRTGAPSSSGATATRFGRHVSASSAGSDCSRGRMKDEGGGTDDGASDEMP